MTGRCFCLLSPPIFLLCTSNFTSDGALKRRTCSPARCCPDACSLGIPAVDAFERPRDRTIAVKHIADSVSGSAQPPDFQQAAVVVRAPELHGAPADALQGGRMNRLSTARRCKSVTSEPDGLPSPFRHLHLSCRQTRQSHDMHTAAHTFA